MATRREVPKLNTVDNRLSVEPEDKLRRYEPSQLEQRFGEISRFWLPIRGACRAHFSRKLTGFWVRTFSTSSSTLKLISRKNS